MLQTLLLDAKIRSPSAAMENNGNANNGAQQAVQLEVGSVVVPFNPAAHNLDPGFRLTRFADLKG